MEWYYIILIVIGYIIMMILTAYLLNRYSSDMEKAECIMCGMFWPFVIVFFTFVIPIGSVVWVIEWVADKWEEYEKKSKNEE